MKASVTFQEEKAPLLRAKIPLSICGFPLSSAIALSSDHNHDRDLTLHLGTAFEAGPSCRVAYKPNDPISPFSLVLKTGFGLWGSPSGAPLAMTAEFDLVGNSGPRFSIRVKPKAGDFSVHRCASSDFNHTRLEHFEPSPRLLRPLSPDSSSGSLLKVEKPSDPILTMDPIGDVVLPTPITGSGFTTPAEKHRSPGNDCNVVIGSNFTFKIEGLDREKKGKSENNLKSEGGLQEEGNAWMKANGNNNGNDNFLATEEEGSGRGNGRTVAVKGWTAHAQTGLHLGKYAKLNILWGLNLPSDYLEICSSSSSGSGISGSDSSGGNGSSSGISGRGSSWFGFPMSKLPFLVVNKLSIEGVSPKPRKQHLLDSSPLDQYQFGRGNDDIANVVASCELMKRQLQSLNGEMEVLRRAMLDMSSGFGGVGALDLTNSTKNVRTSESEARRLLQTLELPPKKRSVREINQEDVEGMKSRKEGGGDSRINLQSDTGGLSSGKVVTPHEDGASVSAMEAVKRK